jgi:hypothetical protein
VKYDSRFSRYSYVNNDPVNKVDPLGLMLSDIGVYQTENPEVAALCERAMLHWLRHVTTQSGSSQASTNANVTRAPLPEGSTSVTITTIDENIEANGIIEEGRGPGDVLTPVGGFMVGAGTGAAAEAAAGAGVVSALSVAGCIGAGIVAVGGTVLWAYSMPTPPRGIQRMRL